MNLAHGMDILVIAEGVETNETLRFLGRIGCDVAQGYFIGRPVSIGDFSSWYRNRRGLFVAGDC